MAKAIWSSSNAKPADGRLDELTKLILLIQIPCGTLFVWVRIFAFLFPARKKKDKNLKSNTRSNVVRVGLVKRESDYRYDEYQHESNPTTQRG